MKEHHLFTGFATALKGLGDTANVSDDPPKANEGQLKFIEDLFKRYTSHKNIQLEARKKGMFD